MVKSVGGRCVICICVNWEVECGDLCAVGDGVSDSVICVRDMCARGGGVCTGGG